MRSAVIITVCALHLVACRGERAPASGTEPANGPGHVSSDRDTAGSNAEIPGMLPGKLMDGENPRAPHGLSGGADVEPSEPSIWSHEPAPGHAPPYERCPVAAADEHDLDRLLESATDSYRAALYAAAYDCASMAADISPRSIEAQHMRAASAAALGHIETAQIAFTLALALDPDDLETLAAAADFFINMMPRHGREPILIGLEQARRGRTRAANKRGVDKALRARLILLEAQALNDLGHAREALARADEALTEKPRWLEAEHERGVALFNLCLFEGASDAFSSVLASAPDDAYAHYHMGLINERLGRKARSEHHFRQARRLAPNDFWTPIALSAREFQNEVDEAIGELPSDLKSMLDQVSIEITDLPSMDDLTAVEPPFSPTILGLFRGLPLDVGPEEAMAMAGKTPVPNRAIVLYRNNLARIARSRAELDSQIRRTLLHELGHLSGLEEDELRRRGLE